MRVSTADIVMVISMLVIVLSLPLISNAMCHARWKDSGLMVRWGPLSGCRVSSDGKSWIPERSRAEAGI